MSAEAAESDVLGLVELIDQLERLLDKSKLSEIEVEAGSTALVVKKPDAFAAVSQAPPGQPAQSARQPPSPRLGQHRRPTRLQPTPCSRR